jgi:hypothetical protein
MCVNVCECVCVCVVCVSSSYRPLTTPDYVFLMQYSPSLIAAAAVCAARTSLAIAPEWPVRLELASGYTLAEVASCVQDMLRCVCVCVCVCERERESA